MIDAEPDLPERIGPYRISGRLGAGGMGQVLRGHDDRLDRPVALKCIRPDAREPEKARQRFRREARAAARLSHSAIVQVYDWVESAGQDWLVMELVEGRTVDELIAAGPLSPERAAAIARHVAAGLAVAHEAGLVHRDLKAANVIVTASGVAKILDFGVAKAVSEEKADLLTTLTGEGQVVGTVAAMSPEQALGRPVDHRSDLFSLGTLLYEMLSGVLPFKGDSAVETLTRICSAKEKPLGRLVPEVPERLSRLVGRLLEKEPSRRPADARQVVAELDRLAAAPAAVSETLDPPTVAERPVVPPQETPSEGTMEGRGVFRAREVSGRRPILFAAAAVLIMVGLWGVFSWLRPPQGGEPGVGEPPSPARLLADEAEPGTVFQKGMELLERFDKNDNIEKALGLFDALVARYPGSASAHAGLSRALWRKSWFLEDDRWLDRARAAAKRAVELDPYLATGQVSLGLVSLQQGDLEVAAGAFEMALRLNPASVEVHRGLGQLYEARGELKNAELAYRRAIEIRPQAWELHELLGALYFRQSRYDEAETAFQQGIAAAPDSTSGLASLSGVYFMRGQFDEAAAELQKAIAIRPSAHLYTNLGNIFFYQGLYEEAIAPFHQAVELEEGARDPLMWGNLGDAYRWTPGREKEARAAYERGIALLREDLKARPGDLEIRSRLALYQARSGSWQEALATADELGVSDGIDPSTWFRLALTYEQCGERQRALFALDQALGAGFPFVAVEREQELDPLRADPGFRRLRTAHGGQG